MGTFSKVRENSQKIIWAFLITFILSMVAGGIMGGFNLVDQFKSWIGFSTSGQHAFSIGDERVSHYDYTQTYINNVGTADDEVQFDAHINMLNTFKSRHITNNLYKDIFQSDKVSDIDILILLQRGHTLYQEFNQEIEQYKNLLGGNLTPEMLQNLLINKLSGLRGEDFSSFNLYSNIVTINFKESEQFTDKNSNGQWDDAEPFTDKGNDQYDEGEDYEDSNDNEKWDEGEPFTDTLNGTWDQNEEFTDLNENGKWDDAEPFIDAKNGIYDEGEEFVDALNEKYDEGEDYEDSNDNGKWDEGEKFTDTLNGKWDQGEEFTDALNERWDSNANKWVSNCIKNGSINYDAITNDSDKSRAQRVFNPNSENIKSVKLSSIYKAFDYVTNGEIDFSDELRKTKITANYIRYDLNKIDEKDIQIDENEIKSLIEPYEKSDSGVSLATLIIISLLFLIFSYIHRENRAKLSFGGFFFILLLLTTIFKVIDYNEQGDEKLRTISYIYIDKSNYGEALNPNNIWEEGEKFEDLNANGKWDQGEKHTDNNFIDSNGNGVYDSPDTDFTKTKDDIINGITKDGFNKQ